MGIKEAIAIVAGIEKEARRQRAREKGLRENDFIFIVRKPSDSPDDKRKIKGNVNRFPIDDDHAAIRAVGIAKGIPEPPWWFEGTIDELRDIVKRVVRDRYPDIDIDEIKPIMPRKRATQKRPERKEPVAAAPTNPDEPKTSL